jgi:hypothetical protein
VLGGRWLLNVFALTQPLLLGCPSVRDRRVWNESRGVVTRAFDRWRITESDIRRFLTLTTRWMDERYQDLWDEVSARPGSEDDDQSDVFHREVDGLWPEDYHWMMQAAVIRDAVTAFEVYLEKATSEVLQFHGHAWKLKPGRTPYWEDLVRFTSGYLGVSIDTGPVRRVRALRHTLTHMRGELRTQEQRDQFGVEEDSGFQGNRAVLTTELVIDSLDELATVVRKVDAAAWRFSYGGNRIANLTHST